jgi:isopentenyl-diphosphate delta-isomerase
MIEADALALHLNVLQEALQPEGQCNFAGLLPKIGQLARALPVPLVVKEVGCGISGRVGRALLEQGVRILDSAGLGGTSWARIEARRAGDPSIGELFADWGLPTPESIRQLRALPEVTVIGSGGLRNGVEVAKAIALGADLAGLAQPFLEAALETPEAVIEKIERIVRELKIAMLCLGARTVAELQKVSIRKVGSPLA